MHCDLEQIKLLADLEWLWISAMKYEEFEVIKRWKAIIAFWRIVDKWDFEMINSVFVRKEFRWEKLWLEIIKRLIENKRNKNKKLYLICRSSLKDYYSKLNLIESLDRLNWISLEEWQILMKLKE